ncbi:hypothetical protein [Leptotrichia sp. OH3620_COT-345]|uniref:hypothetical protein n=1 Tax=Leptotrichia sp. OH3620_COT-345 TaxID=2491048 RepID=UPI0011CF8E6E|nr:hypothetical protein [Leptotrichia sp. OH3620_COT-345]
MKETKQRVKQLDLKRKNYIMEEKMNLLKISFIVGHAIYDWKSSYNPVVKREEKEKTLKITKMLK